MVRNEFASKMNLRLSLQYRVISAGQQGFLFPGIPPNSQSATLPP